MTEQILVIPESRVVDARGGIRWRPERTIQDCQWRIKTFVERDAYVRYDYEGGYLAGTRSTVTWDHVHAMNVAMKARSPLRAWESFVGEPVPELEAIDESLDLVDGDEADMEKALGAVGELTSRLAANNGLSDMSVSKVFHLLRPRFVAISDSYVRELLGITVPSSPYSIYYARRMLAVQRAIRALGQENAYALESLYLYANSLLPLQQESEGEGVPVKLSKVRILDILLWTEEAIQRHPKWSGWYRQEVSH